MDENYRSPFDRWTNAPDLDVPFEPELYFFSRDLTPLLSSPEVQGAVNDEVERAIVTHQLYAYLGFTVRLETEPVNEVAKLLNRPEFLPWISKRRRIDALHVYNDEGKHADWSNQVLQRVVAETGVMPIDVQPGFLAELHRLIEGEPSAVADLVKLFFVIVSETLITGSLNQVPRDESVQQAVRNLTNAHKLDEGRHHKYFKTLFIEVWPTLPYQLKVRMGTLLPSMLRAFLTPDRGYMLAVLRKYRDRFAEPERVVDEVLRSSTTSASLRAAADPSLRIFEEAGIFAEPAVADAFMRNGFTDLAQGAA